MRRMLFILCFIIPACQRTTPQPVEIQTVETVTLPTNSGFPEPAEFAKWPSITDKPIAVGSGPWGLCRPPTSEEDARFQADDKKYGPHVRKSIIVRVNDTGRAVFPNNQAMPVGSTIVKEKHAYGFVMHEYALMIKREAGYDSEHGDWQYVFVSQYDKPQVVEGKLKHCIDCHQGAKDTDYLFKFFLNKQPANENEHEAGLK